MKTLALFFSIESDGRRSVPAPHRVRLAVYTGGIARFTFFLPCISSLVSSSPTTTTAPAAGQSVAFESTILQIRLAAGVPLVVEITSGTTRRGSILAMHFIIVGINKSYDNNRSELGGYNKAISRKK